MLGPVGVLIGFLLIAGAPSRADFNGNTTVSGNVPVVTTAEQSFDGPMVDGVNATSFEWWYFDTVTQDGTQEITITFYRTQLLSDLPEINTVEIGIVWPNGTTGKYPLAADSSSVITNYYGASGVWNGAGAIFNGTSTLSDYTVALDNSVIKGSLSIYSIAPGHYADGLPPGNPDASPLAFPGIYWTNAIPSGIANGKFTVMGETLQFENAIGYHDHNWGD